MGKMEGENPQRDLNQPFLKDHPYFRAKDSRFLKTLHTLEAISNTTQHYRNCRGGSVVIKRQLLQYRIRKYGLTVR